MQTWGRGMKNTFTITQSRKQPFQGTEPLLSGRGQTVTKKRVKDNRVKPTETQIKYIISYNKETQKMRNIITNYNC